jgi:hypothetical protein
MSPAQLARSEEGGGLCVLVIDKGYSGKDIHVSAGDPSSGRLCLPCMIFPMNEP